MSAVHPMVCKIIEEQPVVYEYTCQVCDRVTRVTNSPYKVTVMTPGEHNVPHMRFTPLNFDLNWTAAHGISWP